MCAGSRGSHWEDSTDLYLSQACEGPLVLKIIHLQNETRRVSQAQRALCLAKASPFGVTHLSPRRTAIRSIVYSGKKAWVLTTFSSDVSRPGEVTQPANAHINLSCSLQKQFIPRNDFIISYRFTESHNTSPLSDSHSVLALRRQFTLPVSQDAHTRTHARRKRERRRVGKREAWPATTPHFSLFKKCQTNCVRCLPRLKSLTSKCVILDPKTNGRLKIHEHHEVTVVRCAAEVQLEFRFKPSRQRSHWGGHKWGPKWGWSWEMSRQFWPSVHHRQDLKRPEPPKNWWFSISKCKSKSEDWTGLLFRYRI